MSDAAAKKALITGITGMVGSHLAGYLLHEGVEVHGVRRWRANTENIDSIFERIILHECDLLDLSNIEKVLSDVRPDFIFHLAAQSSVLTSFKSPTATINFNITMQLNLFEAVRKLGLDPRIQIALSSEEYGDARPEEMPLTEKSPLRPLSPYAVSKVAQDMMGYQYFKSYGMKIYRTRSFNHEGAGRADVFVTSNFAKQIAAIEAGLARPVLKVGNLGAKRDWTDVKDIVRGYWLAVNHADPGEVYVLASGHVMSVGEMLDILLSYTDVKPKIEVDPSRLRPSDVEILVGDATKFREKTGWEPRIPYRETLRDILDFWRNKFANHHAAVKTSWETP